MLLFALLAMAQAPSAWEEDPLALEVLDYRGRLAACEDPLSLDFQRKDWRCADLGEIAKSLRVKLTSRPDLLARLGVPFDPKDRQLIMHGDERHAVKLKRVTVEGDAINGRDVRVSIETDGERLTRFNVWLAGQRPIEIKFNEPIDYPDLRSVQLTWIRQMVDVELAFGTSQPWCAHDNDGRSQLTVMIENSRVRASRMGFEKCDLQSRYLSTTVSPAR
jgi:hypothetical protein